MQTCFLAGRDFTPYDRQGVKPVVLVNQTLAARLFPNEDTVGKQICQGMRGDDPFEIIGVVEDGKYVSLGDDPKPVIFWPLYQRYNPTTTSSRALPFRPSSLCA
ncbi:MAG TPA: ABC transporter permease [Bryobacteraceae bacterium]|nr:ABC transporter permease [Bryobacteraceae bacterium]